VQVFAGRRVSSGETPSSKGWRHDAVTPPSATETAIGRDEHDANAGGCPLPFLCECGDLGCDERVPLTAAEYARLASTVAGLALAPGHRLERRPRRPPGHGDAAARAP